jgi:hypothetical protein
MRTDHLGEHVEGGPGLLISVLGDRTILAYRPIVALFTNTRSPIMARSMRR